MGLFVLWWGWLAFNSGSTYGVSGSKWQYAARSAVMTMMGSFGGGISGIILSILKNNGGLDIIDLINGILASLVSVTGGCFLYRAWEAMLIGAIGSLLCFLVSPIFDRLGIDDPVGASAVHGVCGIWGVVAIGFFADNPVPLQTTKGRCGLFKGGGWYLLGIQTLSAICLLSWGLCSTFFLLFTINQFVPIRMNPNEELLGADLTEHQIRHTQIGLSKAISALAPLRIDNKLTSKIKLVKPIGINPGHERGLEELIAAENKLSHWHTYLNRLNFELYDNRKHKSTENIRSSVKKSAKTICKLNIPFIVKENTKNNYNSLKKNKKQLTVNDHTMKNENSICGVENTTFSWMD